ncbi:MAG TPA: [Fe-Fe] hydrogenase large subunit C-terminal domain-containing protein [bacterium]
MTGTFVHSFEIDYDKCCGSMACLRTCPTEALRVRDGKVRHYPEMCVDCGGCIAICPSGAFKVTTDSLSDLDNYQYKVAIPSVTLYGQFGLDVSVDEVNNGLLSLGFDEVYDDRIEVELVTRAISEYIHNHEGPFPLISTLCPVVVRLIQVSYPYLVDQIIPMDVPREIAAREIKKKYSVELGIPADRIAAVYLSPCPGKVTSVHHPAQGGESEIDFAIGISDIYNDLQYAINKNKQQSGNGHESKLTFNLTTINWALSGGQSKYLTDINTLSVIRLENVIHMLEELSMGKIGDIQFLEAFACAGGCVGGPLTVQNIYMARSKLRRLSAEWPLHDPEIAYEVSDRYNMPDYLLKNQLEPRPIKEQKMTMAQRITRMKQAETIRNTLPGIDCAVCGSPTCEVFAHDVVDGEAGIDECFLLSDDIVNKLRKIYRTDNMPPGWIEREP